MLKPGKLYRTTTDFDVWLLLDEPEHKQIRINYREIILYLGEKKDKSIFLCKNVICFRTHNILDAGWIKEIKY